MDELQETFTYKELLASIQENLNNFPGGQPGESFPRTAELNFTQDQVIEVDLNSRTITPPKFLSVRYDHNAEVVYFKCDRFYENIDLANTVCVIEYLNAEHDEGKRKRVRNSGLYWVPYFDVYHNEVTTAENGENVLNNYIYIPWAVGGLATKYEGTVTFALRFYMLSSDKKDYYFNLSTRPCDGKVLHGIDILDGFDFDCEEKQNLGIFDHLFEGDTTLADIYAAIAEGQKKAFVYWEDMFE